MRSNRLLLSKKKKKSNLMKAVDSSAPLIMCPITSALQEVTLGG